MLVHYVYERLSLLSDILAWRSTSHYTRHIGSAIIATRFADIVTPFVRHHVPELYHIIHISRMVITGSCVMKMLDGNHDLADNLNIIAPNGYKNVIHDFITNTLRYRPDKSAQRNYVYEKSVKSFAKFQRGSFFITVSEATGDNVFKAITSSATTADMLCMTPGGVTVFYPLWTLQGVTISNQRVRAGFHDQNVGFMPKTHYKLHPSTAFLDDACGTLCPALWRSINDHGEHSLVLEWDRRFSMKALLLCSNTTWRLAEYCSNTLCALNPTTNTKRAILPPKLMPADLTSIQIEEEHITNHVPVSVSR
jgi:hypothetical protein